MLHTHSRAEEHIGRNPTPTQTRRWNHATDIAINQVVEHAGFTIPQDWLMPSTYDFPANLSAEEYYDLLEEEEVDLPPPPNQQDDEELDGPDPGRGGGTSGSDGQKRKHEADLPDDASDKEVPAMSEYDQQMIERAVAEDTEQYERSRGTVPSGLSRWAKQILRPKVDPFKEFRAACRYVANTTHGHGDYTFRKLPRRWPPGGARLPAPVQPLPRFVVIVDTSGSMNEDDLAKALGVAEQGLRGAPTGSIEFMAGDMEARFVKTVFRVEDVELLGGGGTDMGRLIVQACEQRPVPTGIIVITDGETPWPRYPVETRVVACITRRDRGCFAVPSWITAVRLYDEEDG